MTTSEVINIAVGDCTTLPDNFDVTIPESLAASFDKELWTDCYAVIIGDMLDRIEVDSFKDGVLTYRNRYYKEIESDFDENGKGIGPLDLIDDLVYVYDLKPLILKRLSYANNTEWFDAHFFEAQRFNRSTPLFKYLLKDYEMALDYLYLGWLNRESIYNTSEGTWNYFVSEYVGHRISRSIYSESDAIVYVKLEGELEFMITKEDLDAWGVTEDQLFEDILKHAYDLLKEGLTVTPKSYFDFNLQAYILRHEKHHIPTLVASLHDWLSQSDGVLGSIFVMPDEYNCYVFKFDRIEDLVFIIETMLPHLNKYYGITYSSEELFDNSFYWTKNGHLEKFEVKKENEAAQGEVQLIFPEIMAATINRAGLE